MKSTTLGWSLELNSSYRFDVRTVLAGVLDYSDLQGMALVSAFDRLHLDLGLPYGKGQIATLQWLAERL